MAKIKWAEKQNDATLGKYVKKLESSVSEHIYAIEDKWESTKRVQNENKEEIWWLKWAIDVCDKQVKKLTHKVRTWEVTDKDYNYKLTDNLWRISDYLNDGQDTNSDIVFDDYINCDY